MYVKGDMVRISTPSCPDSSFSGAEGFVRSHEARGVWVDVPTLGEHFTSEANLTVIDAVHNVPTTSGGCWYCETVDKNLVFSMEFDTYVHKRCIQERLHEHPDDLEAQIFAGEFGLTLGVLIPKAYEFFRRCDESMNNPDNTPPLEIHHVDIAVLREVVEAADTEIRCLRKALAWAVQEVEDLSLPPKDEENDETPDHTCGYSIAPDEGHCDFCDGYWTAREMLERGGSR